MGGGGMGQLMKRGKRAYLDSTNSSRRNTSLNQQGSQLCVCSISVGGPAGLTTLVHAAGPRLRVGISANDSITKMEFLGGLVSPLRKRGKTKLFKRDSFLVDTCRLRIEPVWWM